MKFFDGQRETFIFDQYRTASIILRSNIDR